MTDVGQKEKATQERVIKLFTEKMGYKYLGNWRQRENSNIEKELLEKFLKGQGYSNAAIDASRFELDRVLADTSRSFYDVNKDVYNLLRYGIRVKESLGENYQTVEFINWKDPQKNYFSISDNIWQESGLFHTSGPRYRFPP